MSESHTDYRRFSGLQVFMMIVVAMILAVVLTTWLILSDVFVTEFKPVTLSASEEQVLVEKLGKLGVMAESSKAQAQAKVQANAKDNSPLAPEPYSETGADREVSLSEKEVNAILAKNTNLASKLAIDLSDDLVSVKLLFPLDEELPLFGGKTLKVTAGVELAYVEKQPVVVVKGVSIWGVPLPNAYLGDIKNIDLIKEFGATGFWKSFSEGLDDLHVTDGAIIIKLKP